MNVHQITRQTTERIPASFGPANVKVEACVYHQSSCSASTFDPSSLFCYAFSGLRNRICRRRTRLIRNGEVSAFYICLCRFTRLSLSLQSSRTPCILPRVRRARRTAQGMISELCIFKTESVSPRNRKTLSNFHAVEAS